MTDPDPWACPGCLHSPLMHWRDGCHARDDLDNRCACELAP